MLPTAPVTAEPGHLTSPAEAVGRHVLAAANGLEHQVQVAAVGVHVSTNPIFLQLPESALPQEQVERLEAKLHLIRKQIGVVPQNIEHSR